MTINDWVAVILGLGIPLLIVIGIARISKVIDDMGICEDHDR